MARRNLARSGSGCVYVIGAGLAGLACAEHLSRKGERVILHEGSPGPGGRCRSYHDRALDAVIDNGNHLILSGNRATLGYVRRIGGEAALTVLPECAFPFADLRTGARWTIRPNSGRLPWWILDKARRVPGTRASDYLSPLKLLGAGPQATLGERMASEGPLFEKLWRPLLLAALNTEPRAASARLAATLFRETLARGGAACRPVVASEGLGAAFVDPAIGTLRRRGVEMRMSSGLKAIETDGRHIRALVFARARIDLSSGDRVVLAVPAQSAATIVPALVVPNAFSSIANIHFRTPRPRSDRAHAPTPLGIVNGLSEWLFTYPGRQSVTISAADRLLAVPREVLARRVWAEIAALTGLGPDMPEWQIVHEKRATFLATPEQEARRPASPTPFRNLFLAGDYTATGLPATIEGAIRSGVSAADLAARAFDS